MADSSPVHCTQCGREIPPNSPDSLCPACLMTLAIDLGDEDLADAWDSPELEPSSQLGDYRLLEELGRGGMGKVYLAEHIPSGRRVALKMLGQKLHSHEMRQRFFREGRITASIHHPNSLYLYGSEEIDGHPVIIMEVAEAGTLQDKLGDLGRMPVTESVDAILDIIDGLEAAHSAGILHRDVKPSNCFLCSDGTVKIGDYGLSVSTESELDSFEPHREQVIGTPAYASPEQLQGNPLDARSDMFSVGVTLYQLLSGQMPFDGNDAAEIAANVINTHPKPLSTFVSDVPDELEYVIKRCLEKNPDKRFSDYQSLRKALLPYSSSALQPATFVHRTAAGWIDYLVALFPAYAVLMLTVGGKELIVRPLVDPSLYNARYYLLLTGIGILYFTIAESLWGCGIGKHLKGLIVADNKEFRRPRWYQAFTRACIALGLVEIIRMPVLMFLINDYTWSVLEVILFVVITIASCTMPVLVAFRTAGRGIIWDVISGTRVYLRPEGISRPLLEAAQEEIEQLALGTVGPYVIRSVISKDEWLAGFDPVLKRTVWLFRCCGESIPQTRRELARPGRLRWIQDVRSDQGLWDAYSVPPGVPFMEVAESATGMDWSHLRHVLDDVATELIEAENDGTLPEQLTTGHIWVTRNWRALLMDRAWPGPYRQPQCISVKEDAGKIKYLSDVASGVDWSTVPMEAGRLLRSLRQQNPYKPDAVARRLRALAGKPSVVGKALRLASESIIPLYIWMAAFVGYFHDKPLSHLHETASAVSLNALAGIAALQLLIMVSFGTSIGHSIFNLSVVSAIGEPAARSKQLYRFALAWGSLFMPVAAVQSLLPHVTNSHSGAFAVAWIVLWALGVVWTTTHARVNWIDLLTGTRVVRQ